MSSVSHISQALGSALGNEIEQLGRETGFVQRESKLTAKDFVRATIFAWLQEPGITLDGISQVLGRCEVAISASGLSQRFGEASATLMQRVLERLTAYALGSLPVEIELLKRFTAVVVEDSSTIVLPDELADRWAGCGGKGEQGRAALKLFARWDVLSGRLEGPCLTTGRHSDKCSPFDLDRLPAGCLYLSDLGFYSAQRLMKIKGGKASKSQRYFASRYMPRTILLDRHGQRIHLQEIGPKQEGACLQQVAVLAQEGLVVRLLMQRVPESVAKARQQRIREAASDHGREPDAETLELANWTIVITNVPSRLLSGEELLVLMRLRWQIELLFKLWKEEGQVDQWQSKNPWRILTELYAKLFSDGDPTLAHYGGNVAGPASQPGQSGSGGAPRSGPSHDRPAARSGAAGLGVADAFLCLRVPNQSTGQCSQHGAILVGNAVNLAQRTLQTQEASEGSWTSLACGKRLGFCQSPAETLA